MVKRSEEVQGNFSKRWRVQRNFYFTSVSCVRCLKFLFRHGSEQFRNVACNICVNEIGNLRSFVAREKRFASVLDLTKSMFSYIDFSQHCAPHIGTLLRKITLFAFDRKKYRVLYIPGDSIFPGKQTFFKLK